MRRTSALAAAVGVFLSCIPFTSAALADAVVSEAGEGAGQVSNPRGIAIDNSSGTLYVADRGNNRIDVFDAAGNFLSAFGWGVANGVSAPQTCSVTCRAGINGSGPGQFSRPTGVAVDNDPSSPSFHDLYVFDSRNLRVQKFSPAGTFLLALGGGVNQTTGKNLCVAGTGDVCGAGSSGTGEGQFGLEDRPLAVGPGGTVYVGDAKLVHDVPRDEFANRVQKFDPAGVFAGEIPIPFGSNEGRLVSFTVDSTGDFYVFLERAQGAGLRKYDGSGTLLTTFAGFEKVISLAVDGTDDIFIANEDEELDSIFEFDSAGLPQRQFAYEFPEFAAFGLAPFSSPSGDIYASEEFAGPGSGRILHVSFPPAGPVVLPQPCENAFVGNVRATVRCRVNPEGSPTTLHFQYIDQTGFENGGFANPDTEENPESASIGEDFHLHAAPLSLEGLIPETTYHYRVVATNGDGGPVIGPESTFTTKPPFELGANWASAVSDDSARLNAELNPLGVAASGYFEYVDEASFQESGFAAAAKAPAPPAAIDFEAGEAFEVGGVDLDSLAQGTSYRYRLVVSDEFVTVIGPEHSFTTFRPATPGLPDERGYEMVSPALKESGEAGNPGGPGGLFDSAFQKIQEAAADGEAFTFTSFTAFSEPQSAPGAGQYLSTRGDEGWSTENITPPGQGGSPLQPPFRGFTPDLSFGAVAVFAPPLTADASPDFENLYLRESAGGALRTLTPVSPLGPKRVDEYCVGFGGASADGSRALLIASGSLTPDAPVKPGFSLYEWSATAGLRLVSKLPGEVAAQPSEGNGFGARGLGCGDGGSIVRHAISSDGRRIFWTFVPKTGATRLLARINGAETIQLDAKQGGPGSSGGGQYWGASADGSRVVFTDSSRLVPGAKEDDLYLYDFEAPAGSRLSDLTLAPAAAGVRGVVGLSEDASHVYFTATGVLTEAENGEGESAQAGSENLYLWDGGQVEFVARLSALDLNVSTPHPIDQMARVSPDGRSLAFISYASLTGYDNTVEGAPGCVLSSEGQLIGGPKCAEAFLYDAESGRLSCPSCNPSGGRPTGPTAVPAWTSPFEQPRYLADDGRRLFFQTLDALDPRDANGRSDVYEFEREGAGSCDSAGPRFSESAGGCVFLISSGASPASSYLLDASADGRDVFFSTRQPLVGQDEDERYDVYDARVGGGFPPPVPTPGECDGEACRPGTAPPPSAAAPASATAPSDGNVKQSRNGKACSGGKHRVKRHGKARCVKTGGRTGQKRGTGR